VFEERSRIARDEGIHVEQLAQRTSLSPAPPVRVEDEGWLLTTRRASRTAPNICLVMRMNGRRRK
jgi:hypothetical protein